MTASVTSIASVRPKEFHFPVEVEWIGGRRVSVRVDGKPAARGLSTTRLLR